MQTYDFDHNWFLTLNFDGGEQLDELMLAISGVKIWIPLYIFILVLVWRRYGWRDTALFLLCIALALGASDMLAGVFKHTGPLKGLWPDFPPRWRPMFEPALEGLAVLPDTLQSWRWGAHEALSSPVVHVPREALGGSFGTVSAHAATNVALALLAGLAVRRRWFTCLIVVTTILICYSRIYLAKHYPADILLGTLLGLLCGYAAWRLWGALKSAMAQKSLKRC